MLIRNFLIFIILLFSMIPGISPTFAEQNSDKLLVSTKNISIRPKHKIDTIPGLRISDGWTRQAIPPNNSVAVYMKIHNSTKKAFVLSNVSAMSSANNVEIHKNYVDEKGVNRVSRINRVVIPAESTVELKPGALNIMLFDLKSRVKIGAIRKVTLYFAGKGKVIVPITVLRTTATSIQSK